MAGFTVFLTPAFAAFVAQSSPAGNPAPALPPASEATFSWSGYFEALGVMLLLLGGLWLVTWAVRRYAKLPFLPAMGAFPKNGLRMETQLPLGPRRGLVVVRFLNERLLLGVTDQQIRLLRVLPLEDADDEPDEHPAPRPSRLKKMPDEPCSCNTPCEPGPASSVAGEDAKAFARLLEQATTDSPPSRPGAGLA